MKLWCSLQLISVALIGRFASDSDHTLEIKIPGSNCEPNRTLRRLVEGPLGLGLASFSWANNKLPGAYAGSTMSENYL